MIPLQHCPLPDQDTDTSTYEFSRKHLQLSFGLSLVDGPHVTHLPKKGIFSYFTSSFRRHPRKTIDSDMFPLYTNRAFETFWKQIVGHIFIIGSVTECRWRNSFHLLGAPLYTSTFPLSQNAQFKDSQRPLNTYFLLIYNETYLFALGSSLKLKLLNTHRIAVFLHANIFSMTIYPATCLETEQQFYIYCYFLHFLSALVTP